MTKLEPGPRVSIHLILALCPSINLLNVEGMISGWKSSINLLISSSLDSKNELTNVKSKAHHLSALPSTPAKLQLVSIIPPISLSHLSYPPPQESRQRQISSFPSTSSPTFPSRVLRLTILLILVRRVRYLLKLGMLGCRNRMGLVDSVRVVLVVFVVH